MAKITRADLASELRVRLPDYEATEHDFVGFDARILGGLDGVAVARNGTTNRMLLVAIRDSGFLVNVFEYTDNKPRFAEEAETIAAVESAIRKLLPFSGKTS